MLNGCDNKKWAGPGNKGGRDINPLDPQLLLGGHVNKVRLFAQTNRYFNEATFMYYIT